jgi:trans-2-enoyl-CoA reductase
MYKARIKSNTCTNSHPVGCFYNVYEQILKAKEKSKEKVGGQSTELNGKMALVLEWTL